MKQIVFGHDVCRCEHRADVHKQVADLLHPEDGFSLGVCAVPLCRCGGFALREPCGVCHYIRCVCPR